MNPGGGPNRRLVYVVGPSGAGKDSLLRALPTHLGAAGLSPQPVHVARRTITRPQAFPGDTHEAVSPQQFQALREAGAFAMDWQANGQLYGVCWPELAPLARGGWVFVNGSRAWLEQARRRFAGLTAVQVLTPAEHLRARLRARGRETPEQIESRVRRAREQHLDAASVDVQILNDGALATALQRLLAALQQHPAARG